ncbi:phosphoadenosine phosphosulfate reductase family protein [Ignicoccus hospitalis]|uniref:Phosphoadenosine phosphosulfate reductase n=1 Tax=Ignicoccus hospitalis (strain KIN4/I / DSM 18386 / JCM 14125) TaxID=453591 RepID=A8ACD0_IGNH4|nr:phosphoadenosine phosphosulfate reductase family protein [Ignicoccus hospitalis]ABU82582.1 phosphoadenosine phosphosulfate reductase [Ignicoccus hospitalis KIN4/I]HIH90747.1 phosphoadenosine phosphosulfate reductase family protein [Desulfurococcaceae archaeon]
MERYPEIKVKRVASWLVDSAEFTGINDDVYLWLDVRKAIRINDFIDGNMLKVSGITLNFGRFFEDIKWPFVSVAGDYEGYLRWLSEKVPPNIKVVLNFSGGKDSVAAAKVLSDLGADVTLLYSHVSYLENPRNVDFVEKVANRLGVKLVVVEADREIMRNMLKQGMPFRGNRWCTTQKVKPIRKVLKEMKDYVRADGERMFESIKRFKRLSFHSPTTPKVFDFKKVRPIFLLTLIDVVKIVREVNAVHPDYLKGLPRVACTFCPYKTLHELDESVWNEVEDPGIIEEAIKASYRRFEYDMPWEDFFERHMWRFSPKLANVLYKIQQELERKLGELEIVTSERVRSAYSSVWTEELPAVPELPPERAYKIFVKVMMKTYERMLESSREGG